MKWTMKKKEVIEMVNKKKTEAKQEQLPEMQSPGLRNKIIEAEGIKDEIGGKHKQLKELLDDIRKMMREIGKKSLTCEDNEGKQIIIRLISVGEKVSISVVKSKKKSQLDVE